MARQEGTRLTIVVINKMHKHAAGLPPEVGGRQIAGVVARLVAKVPRAQHVIDNGTGSGLYGGGGSEINIKTINQAARGQAEEKGLPKRAHYGCSVAAGGW